MATIVNDRDNILQVATPRIEPSTNNYIYFSIAAPVFRVTLSGTSTPSSYAIQAKFAGQIAGTVVWSVVSGTLTSASGQSGNTWTLTAAQMSTDTVVIRATLTYLGSTFSSDLTLSKVTEGQPGTIGSLTGYGSTYGISSSSWDDGIANRVIRNLLTGETLTTTLATTDHLVAGDTVTLSNNSNFAATRTWRGTSWIAPGTVIDGNLLVTGTVTADKVTAGSITTGASANARINIGDINFIGGITSPLHVSKVSAQTNQAMITALNDKDTSVAIWGASAYTNGNAVSGTWHSSATELSNGRWQMIGILGSHLYNAAVAGTTFGSGYYAGWFRAYNGANSATPGSVVSEVQLATNFGGTTRSIIATGPVQLFGTSTSLILNNDVGTSGQVLTSQGAGATPVWTTPSTGGSVTYASIQTALSPAQSTPLELGATFRSTGTTVPTSGSGIELAYFGGEGYVISGTRTGGGALSSYSPLKLQGSTVSLVSTPATSSNDTSVATTAYVINRISNDAPTKTGSGASGTWSINISGSSGSTSYATSAGNASTVGGKYVTGGSGSTGGGGTTTVSTGLSSVDGFSATPLDGYVCGITSISGGSVTISTRGAAGGALSGGVAFRWTAVGT